MLVAAHVLIAGVAVGLVDLQWATSMALAVAVLSKVVVRAPIAMALAWMGLYAAVIGWTQVGVGMRLVWALGFMLVAAYGGLCLHRRLRAERWGPTAVVTGLSLTLSVVAAHLTVTMISLRAHPSVIGERWMMVSLMGVFVGVTTLFASIMPWRALRRAAAARGGRIDEQGLIRFFDGREGRGEPGEPGEVIGWPSRRRNDRAMYREDAGPARFRVFRGDRSEYVEHARRRAMEIHLWGLAIAWLTGGPLIGARLAGVF